MNKNAVFLYSLLQLKKIRDNFFKELVYASSGKKTSLAFIKNPLPKRSPIGKGETFQVMVIGGSVFEKAQVKKINNKIIILSYKKTTLPIFKTAKALLVFFEKHLERSTKLVVLNFAYGLRPVLRDNLLDGKLISVTKEQQFKDLINKTIGWEIEKYIFQKQKKRIKVSVVNDTITLLLAMRRSSYNYLGAAGVVGTGTNFSFFLDENTAVNLESGNFNKLPKTETGKIIDKNSINPGQQLFEKEVSGAYLYLHYNLRNDGEKIPHFLLSTYQLSSLANDDLRGHREAVAIARKLIERSASLIACQMAGIYLFKKSEAQNSYEKNSKFEIRSTKQIQNSNDKDSKQKSFENLNLENSKNVSSFNTPISDLSFAFIMEGSLFWQGWQYRKRVEDYLNLLGVKKGAIEFIKIKNSSILGASQLIIVNN